MDTHGAVLIGAQRPAYWTAPPRHRDPEDGCRACERQLYDTGCGNYVSREVLDWAANYWTLDDWQDWSLTEILGVKPNQRWASTESCEILPRQNGKGTNLEVRELAGLYVLGEQEITHTAHLFSTAQKHFIRCTNIVEGYADLSKWVKRINRTHGQEAIELRAKPTLIFGPRGSQVRRSFTRLLQFVARNGKQGRGFTSNCLVYDEAMYLTAEMIGASRPTLRAVANHQIILMGSAGLKDYPLWGTYHERIVEDRQTLFGAEWGGLVLHTEKCPRSRTRGRKTNDYVVDCTLHDDRDDPRSWARSNPAFGIRVEQESFEGEIESMDPGEFNREILNVGEWPVRDGAWRVLDKDKWNRQTAEAAGTVAPVTLAVEVDEDGKGAAIGAAWYSGDGANRKLVVSNPKDCVLETTDGLVEQLARIYGFIRKNFGPVLAIVVPKDGAAAGVGDEIEKVYRDKVIRATSTDQATAFAFFTQQVSEGGLWHYPQERAGDLYLAVGSAETRIVGDGGKTWKRKDAAKPVSPASSVSLAAWILNKKRGTYDPLRSIG